MFSVWDVTAVRSPYDWQSVAPVPRVRAPEAWEDSLRDPGESPPDVVHEQRPPPRRSDPYREAATQQKAPLRRAVATVADLMTVPVVYLHPEDTVATAWQLVRERRFRHIPILGTPLGGGERRLVGMVSDRDLLRVAGTPDHRPTDAVGQRALRTLMRSPVFSAAPDASVRSVARVMFGEHVGSMPICSETGQLLGIVTRSDILRGLLADAPLDLWI